MIFIDLASGLNLGDRRFEYQLSINHSEIFGSFSSVIPGKLSDGVHTQAAFSHELYRTISPPLTTQ